MATYVQTVDFNRVKLHSTTTVYIQVSQLGTIIGRSSFASAFDAGCFMQREPTHWARTSTKQGIETYHRSVFVLDSLLGEMQIASTVGDGLEYCLDTPMVPPSTRHPASLQIIVPLLSLTLSSTSALPLSTIHNLLHYKLVDCDGRLLLVADFLTIRLDSNNPAAGGRSLGASPPC